MSYNIFLLNDTIKDTNLSNQAIACYIALRFFLKQNIDEYLISSHQLVYALENKINFDRQFLDYIEEGIADLDKSGLIKIINEIKPSKYLINMKNLNYSSKSNYFCSVTIEEVHSIFNIEGKGIKNKINILSFFVKLVSLLLVGKQWGIDYKGEHISAIFASPSISDLESLTGFTEKTIIEYIKCLENNKIIYVYRANDLIRNADGTIKSITNVYGRYENKKHIITKGKEYVSKYGHNFLSEKKASNKKIADKRRSLAAKYNLLTKGQRYAEDILKEIYEYCIEFNNKTSDPSKHKDISIFESCL